MLSIHANPEDIPTREETEYWNSELAAYNYVPPDKRANENQAERWGWGIPPERRPPPEAVNFVIAAYRERKRDLYVHDPRDRDYVATHPKFKHAFITAVWAHFLWFRTASGGQWINRFFGIQEVPPEYDGFDYSWVHPKTEREHPLQKPNRIKGRIPPGSVELRMFRQWERDVTPPILPGQLGPYHEMVALMDSNDPHYDQRAYRNPYANRAGVWKEGVFAWVGELLGEWFRNPDVNDRLPPQMRGRITGADWVRSAERAPGIPLYGALSKIARYADTSKRDYADTSGRAYLIEESNGTIHWCAGNEIRIVPKLDNHRLIKQDKTEEQLQKEFQCKSCRATRTCVPGTGKDHLCWNCHARQYGAGTGLEGLHHCTMLPECKRCCDSIGSNTQLVNLREQWSRGPRTGL